ncbi:hypothetical protein [Parafrankia sp. FMc2]|uniref:hypothetical protein n=1 Tax=Parafrankia sp. FMc2 TaxID=3233196 RepID=UPI0034D6D162
MRSALDMSVGQILTEARWAQDRAQRGGLPGFRARQLADRLQAGVNGVEFRLRSLVQAGVVQEIRYAGAPRYRVTEPRR